jgi:hypothetical protein
MVALGREEHGALQSVVSQPAKNVAVKFTELRPDKFLGFT